MEKERQRLDVQIKSIKAKLHKNLPLHEAMAAMGLERSSDRQSGLPEVKCPVCLSVPRRKVLTCWACDAALCNACQSRLKECPCCRADFKGQRPRRNRWAEEIVRVFRDK